MNKPAHPVMTSAGKARFSSAEFLNMAALGTLDDMNVELIDGEIERMNPPMSGHAGHQAAVGIRLSRVIDPSRIPGKVGIDLGDDTIVACDVALVADVIETDRLLTPADLLLVVEIAHSTLDRDLGLKRAKYAAAAIGHYWVVDGAKKVTHVFVRPVEGDYTDVRTVAFHEPLAVPGTDASITIA